MALSTARIQRVRGRPPLLAAGIKSLIHSHSSSVKSLGYVFSFISPCYTTHEDFSDRLLEVRGSGRTTAPLVGRRPLPWYAGRAARRAVQLVGPRLTYRVMPAA